MNGKISKMPSMYIEYEVKDKNGKIIQKGKKKGHSWVGNIIGLLSSLTNRTTINTCSTSVGFGSADLVDVNGTAVGVVKGAGVNAGSGESNYGIVIGQSDAPVALSQYNLLAKISHGTSSGQMLYNASTAEAMVKDTTWYFRVIRTFSNNSGASIVVKEIGLVYNFLAATSSATTYYNVLLARDVIPSGITVPNGSTLTLRYIISYSLS